MANTAEINTDGMNIYLTSTVRSYLFGKIVLTILNVSVLIIYFFILANVEKEEAAKFFIPAMLMFIAFVFFPWRYWFWNIFGKEHLVINTKTIMTYFDYGIVQTKPTIIRHHKLASTYEFVGIYDGIECGRLKFISYNPETNLPEIICETSIVLPKGILEEIDKKLEDLFAMEKRNSFFSAN